MDWLDLLAIQGSLKSLLQHHSSKASILQCSAFFIVQLSHPYINTGLLMVTFINSSTIDYFGLRWKSSHKLTKKRKRKFMCTRSCFEVAACMKDRTNDYTQANQPNNFFLTFFILFIFFLMFFFFFLSYIEMKRP